MDSVTFLENTSVVAFNSFCTSFIYSRSISHILHMNSSVWAIWAAQGSYEEKKMNISEQLLRVFFSTSEEQKSFNFFPTGLEVHLEDMF